MEQQKTNRNLIDITAEQIVHIILENHMRPGERLPTEAELAEQLGVGRSTLREAVRRLESRNILSIRQGSGTYVSDKNGIPEDPLGLTMLYGVNGGAKLAVDLLEVRLLLEPKIAFLTASRITPEQEKLLLQYHEELQHSIREERDIDGTSDKNQLAAEVRYHGFIAECAGNSVLKNLVPIINSSISLAISSWNDSLRCNALAQHEIITQAICRHDALGAEYAVINHLNDSREYFLQEIRKQEAGENLRISADIDELR